MEDISIRRALAWPVLLTVIALCLAAAMSLRSGVSGYRVFLPYIAAWGACSVICVLLWIFIEVARLAQARVDHPLRKVADRMSQPVGLILLPGLIFPVFIAAYTWAKSSIPFVVGYSWERFWADADRSLLPRMARP